MKLKNEIKKEGRIKPNSVIFINYKNKIVKEYSILRNV